MKQELSIFKLLITILFATLMYIALAVLLCTLMGCAPTGLEDMLQMDPLPTVSQDLAASQVSEALPTVEPVELPVREVPLTAGFEDYYAIRRHTGDVGQNGIRRL